MNYPALLAEVQTDPTNKGYAAYLPSQPGHVVDLLNAVGTDQLIKSLPTNIGMAWAAAGPYARIVDAANTANHPCRASCLVVMDTFKCQMPINMEYPTIQAMFTGWVTAGVITQAEKDDLVNQSKQYVSRAEFLGFGVVTEADLRQAGVV